MGTQTEIDRIKAAKDDIIAALTEKKITVPEETNIESLADLVRSIPEGAQVASGTFTTTSNRKDYWENLTFPCNFIPDLLVIALENVEENPDLGDSATFWAVGGTYEGERAYVACVFNYSWIQKTAGVTYTLAENTLNATTHVGMGYFFPYSTYRWVAIAQ